MSLEAVTANAPAFTFYVTMPSVDHGKNGA